ncbi:MULTISPECIES: 3-hydroxyacyl-CoA dehydrogenase family protein [Desulfosporosinus]|uniref:3-hydroxyacyl-CoA dehydrogenase NAD-binding domain-containing protein n=1 Tax=Desulfosporosinus nitroreducens TaxID=2018668 RepID=A0ABT8QPH0_9FIRM|nr:MULTISPECIES: 3-hydroxyacyl-CoA dehydrogenase NAD-binding domain-containing protein [Desulfosporosinus]MCO1599927.1 3-hydroxyacyl-CoA dehydrogenase NAD-binding domain-containing protein [Desulfosporosinus nitroreducens]MCO5387898.1 3-hydroxyacyl-CoA dehydrogenase NAD-binding domain-containing protein [Desulfosporosinus sp.]MDA8224039.1 3-hydroxyacyl-CoA dehydrogenase NAD-binding domain-containing protein [Desulfitobacterium hafniense]MDO0823030.1 3-hydroxyacyl-CoA dehydrogenase NAD-binding d
MSKEIKNIAVVGSGIMGTGIVYAGLVGGYNVTLYGRRQEALEQGKAYVQKNLQTGVKIGKVTQETMDSCLARMKVSNDLETAVKDADLVIETIAENIDMKGEILKQLNVMCPEGTIIATNTSSLSVTAIGSFAKNAELVIGMHFFNPVPKMKLVEIVKGLKTSDETVQAIITVAEQMGKQTVVVNDAAGFATSRLNVLLGNEAFYMLMEGVASAEDIDKAAKIGLNLPMGPLEMSDMVGLDTRYKVLEYLHKTLGERFRPCPLMKKYVDAGLLGRKTGEGVFKYENK